MASAVVSPGTANGARGSIVVLLADGSVAHVQTNVAIETSVCLSICEGLADGKVTLDYKHSVDEVIRVRVIFIVNPHLKLEVLLQKSKRGFAT